MSTSILFFVKKLLSALILPPNSLILLSSIGLWLTNKYPKAGKTVVALSLSALFILSQPIVGNALLHSLENYPPINQAQLRDIQAIVILGGGTSNNAPEYGGIDTINKWTLERLRYGAHLQQQTGKPILVTGGAPYGGRPEADAMAESLLQDFHAKTVWIENNSNDTAANALRSSAILKLHNITHIAIVSQAWHLPRAVNEFRKQGFAVEPAGVGYSSDEPTISKFLPGASGLLSSSLAIKEYLALILHLSGTTNFLRLDGSGS